MATALMAQVLRTTMELVEARAGWIVRRQEGQLTVVAAVGGSGTAAVGATIGADVGLAGFVLGSGQAVALSSTHLDPRFRSGLPLLDDVPRTAAAVPCLDGTEVIGVLELFDAVSGHFGIEEVEVLGLMASIVGAALALDAARPTITPEHLVRRLAVLQEADPATFEHLAMAIDRLVDHG